MIKQDAHLLSYEGQSLVSLGLPARHVDCSLLMAAGRELLLVAEANASARLAADVREGGTPFAWMQGREGGREGGKEGGKEKGTRGGERRVSMLAKA
jgi:hypothetical protein